MTNRATDTNFPFGQIVGFHGLDGIVKVRPSTNNPAILLEVKNLQARCAAGEFQLSVRKLWFERRLLFVAFEGHPDRTAVEYLAGAELTAPGCELLPLEEEEFWVDDLIGTQAYTTGGDLIGSVVSVIESGSYLIEIRRDSDPPGKTILVPFVRDIVPVVDVKQRRLEIEPINGLLDAQ
jgi:16S rRNA processing protein RimM